VVDRIPAMTFLAPWAGWFLAGVPVIVVLYLLKLQRRPLTVSTLMFWQQLMRESRRRSLFQRLRHLLSLLLHLLIFLLLVAALARPTFEGFRPQASSTVLVIDGRARMQALEENGASRFDRARELAQNYARQASASQQLAVVMAGASEHVVIGFTGDEKPLRQALAGMQPSDAGGDFEHAIAFAQQLLESRSGGRRIVVITDRMPVENEAARASSGIAPAAAGVRQTKNDSPPASVQFVAAGTNRDNLAITRFATRKNLANTETCEILLEVQNFAAASKQGNVELFLDGALIDVKPFALQSGEAKTELFSALPRPGPQARGWFTARLDTKDALAIDDVAFAIIPRKAPARVLLVSQGNWFLEKLLASDQEIEFEMVAPDAFRLPMAAQFDAVVCDNVVPAGLDMAGIAGNFFFLRSSPVQRNGAGTITEQPLITDVDGQHPILRLVNLQNITIARANQLTLPPEENGWKWAAPLRSFDQPLLLAGARRAEGREQRMIVLGFDIAESDLPLRIAFPLMMSNALNWLAQRTPALHDSCKAGEPLALEPGETVEPQSGTDLPTSAAMAQGTDTLFLPLKNGFYARMNASGDDRWIAVNTFDPAESDLRQPPGRSVTFAREHFSGWRVFLHFGVWPPWQYLTLSALGLFALEWWLFHRRRTE